MRIVLQGQDLSGQTIKGEPFSYIGNCTGTDIKFVGDWKHVSHYHNDFLRPDWSGAETRWSYSRLNTFTDAIVSPDAGLLDHEMMLAMFEEVLPRLKKADAAAVQGVIDGLKADIQSQVFIVSWSNLSPNYANTFSTARKAEDAFRKACGGREHLVHHFTGMAHEDPDKPAWDGSKPPNIPSGGVCANDWGIVARNSRNGDELKIHWSELPKLDRPHDRVEMAERLEALIEKETAQRVTLYVQSILPWWGCRVLGWWQERDAFR